MKTIKSIVLALAVMLVLSACAVGGGVRDEQKLALYRAHAGAPVDSFNYYGRINGWSPLGDSTLVVWTRPGEAWLLELSGPCQDLAYTHAIGLTSNLNRVHARFDKVLVRSTGTANMPCFIQTIQPLDVKAVRASEKALRDASVEQREAAGG